jgi:hypothetical protein
VAVTDRLYALSGSYTSFYAADTVGPSLLISDPTVALRWFLTHEREGDLAVAMQVSDDAGATWRLLPTRQLHEDVELVLADARRDPDVPRRRVGARLQDALDREAAEWLDARIGFAPPEEPVPPAFDVPEAGAWERAGRAWVLAMDALPSEAVLGQLTARYATARTSPWGQQGLDEGLVALRAAARQTLVALIIADTGVGTVFERLLAAADLDRLAFALSFGISQLRGRAKDSRDGLVDSLAAQFEETAALAAEHPNPTDPVRQGVREYILRIARSTAWTGTQQSAPGDALAELGEAVARAAQQAASLPAGPAAAPRPDAVPGFPRHLPDLHAAVAWRGVSPAARRDAELAEADLAAAGTRLAAAMAEHGTQPGTAQPRSPEEQTARETHAAAEQQVAELTARHAALMHGSILADAEEAVQKAEHQAIVNAVQATLPPASSPRSTVAEVLQEHEALQEHFNAAKAQIDAVLDEQRQLARDALHRLLPEAAGEWGMEQLRTVLIGYSGLSMDAVAEAELAATAAAREASDLQSRLNQPAAPGEQPVASERVAAARARSGRAEERLSDLTTSRPVTLRALKALRSTQDLPPSETILAQVAQRAARIVAQSRQRTGHPPTGPDSGRRAPHGQQPQQPQQTQQTQHLPTGPGHPGTPLR